jgi:tellurite resistance protein
MLRRIAEGHTMVKKGLFAGGAIVLLLGLLFGRDAVSYTTTTLGWVRQSVNDAVPVEFELTRARDMIAGLRPEIERNMHLIAKEEVEVKGLKDQLAVGEKSLAKSKSEIERLASDLKRGDSNFVYCGKAYTSRQVETDLTQRLETHKVKQATIDKLSQILAARERGLVAGREKLKAMQAAKSQLEVDVANLEARYEMVRVAQSTSEFNFDDSHLARTKEMVKGIGTKIEVAEKLVNAETTYPGQINLEEPVSSNVLEEVARYFGDDANESVAVKLE